MFIDVRVRNIIGRLEKEEKTLLTILDKTSNAVCLI
jgi:hypothetical protein